MLSNIVILNKSTRLLALAQIINICFDFPTIANMANGANSQIWDIFANWNFNLLNSNPFYFKFNLFNFVFKLTNIRGVPLWLTSYQLCLNYFEFWALSGRASKDLTIFHKFQIPNLEPQKLEQCCAKPNRSFNQPNETCVHNTRHNRSLQSFEDHF